ncbi:Gfo/Idh/MocA family oxidoreductase [Aeromicrobium sp.]|uniref:Gfo/Idh/MocA family protein n=1 Tax=Aeromicrobium sp. TaxID=1871063 RepID=UPI0025C3A92C|nr:Gfo/Idh/MocA family oxidoreductase [Aeromicrobium sp.]MCK5892606.1 Gfo/Idh/MocA family oxidoreductase [Aeromicrobium sp.]
MTARPGSRAEPVRLGIVGLGATSGWAARSHVPATRLVPQVRVVACASSSPASAQAAAQAHGIGRWHPDARSLVHDPDVEVVVVSVKVPEHRDLVLRAIEAGKHVYCEWPLARDAEEAQELLTAARTAQVQTFVGLQSRWAPGVAEARRLVAAGALGRVLDVQVTGHGLVGSPTQDDRGAYQLDPANGAHLGTIALAHVVDALDEVVGPWTVASGVRSTQHPDVQLRQSGGHVGSTSPDHLAVTGLAGTAVVSVHLRPGVPSDGLPGLRWEVRGSAGSLTIVGDLALPEMTRTSLELRTGGSTETRSWGDLVAGAPGDDPVVVPLVAAWTEVAAAVRSGGTAVPGFDRAVALHERFAAIRWADTGA